MTTTYPTCSTPGCDQEIYLRPGERTVCAGCHYRGGPPPQQPEPEPEAQEVVVDWGPVPSCQCGRPVSRPDVSGDRCMRCWREDR
ncbi:hypothetical protein SAMN06265360_107231 [Haloechinothrix alba]|uniref:Uncharacterized protein n=1 Tax=Haloechinothrix alba TaxID=664784 RepID=A0A238WU78_9PSEU|nr:hypothetical protein SAMN06265360_107231 [Haloechinothrix alba]